MRRLIILVVGLMAAALLSAPQAAADPVVCTPNDAALQLCTVTAPGGPGGPGSPPPPPPPGGITPVGTGPKCVNRPSGVEVPCTRGDGWWSNDKQCYVSAVTPPPPASWSEWKGHVPGDGAIYQCKFLQVPGGQRGQGAFFFWSATPPGGPAAPPDPVVLARAAVAQMGLRAITVGIVPEPLPGRVGIIGLPTWMWADTPSPDTMGPMTRTASSAGYTVTATATVSRIVWTMGDGAVVVCSGPGTPYADSYGAQDSPTCGHTYTKQGHYTVQARSEWTVRWAGIGQTGTIPITFTSTAAIVMGEVQVLNR